MADPAVGMSRAGARSYGEGCTVVGWSANDELDERAEQGELDEEEATCPFDGLHLGLGDVDLESVIAGLSFCYGLPDSSGVARLGRGVVQLWRRVPNAYRDLFGGPGSA